MAQTPRDVLERERTNVEELADEGELSGELADALVEWSIAADPDKARHTLEEDGSLTEYSARTLGDYLTSLRVCAERGLDLLDADAEAVDDFMAVQHDDRGLSKATICRYQAAVQSFYSYHEDRGVDPDAITMYSTEGNVRHDERDMFSEDEVEALRDACDYPRDRALLEMLIYTGQRITALRTLRVRDIDLDEGVFYLNDEADGLKGAAKRGRKRPLFGAAKYVRDWLEYHPWSDTSGAFLFTARPNHYQAAPDSAWSKPAIHRMLKNLADEAGVSKPTNPHNFRHYFVTVMKRDYDLDNDTLRMLLGVKADSDILERTYSHVTDEDYLRKAEQALGYRDESERSESPMTPESCPTCGELLDDHWRRCPTCGEAFAPGLDGIEDDVADAKRDMLDRGMAASDLTSEQREGLRLLLETLDDPIDLLDAIDHVAD